MFPLSFLLFIIFDVLLLVIFRTTLLQIVSSIIVDSSHICLKLRFCLLVL